MADFRNAWVHVKVTEWVQTITNTSDPEAITSVGTGLRANCTVESWSSLLRLSSGESLSKLWVEMDLIEGPALMGDGKPVASGVGVFDYGKAVENIPAGIYCYMGFQSDHYKEIWAQVRSGAFNQCGIQLDVGPLPREPAPSADLIWDVGTPHPRLYVQSATVRFSYRPRLTPDT